MENTLMENRQNAATATRKRAKASLRCHTSGHRPHTATIHPARHRIPRLPASAPPSQESTPPMTDDDTYWDTFPDALTTAHVAKILKVGTPAVLNRLRSGLIPAHFIVGSWIIFKAEVRAWLESTSNQRPPAPPEPVDVLAGYSDEMDYRDLITLLGRRKQTIYNWLNDGVIPAYHVDSRWIVHKSQLRQKLHDTSNQRDPETGTTDPPEAV